MSAYTEALKAAMKERGELLGERQRLDRRLLRINQTIATLLRLDGSDCPESISNKGIADAIRDLLGFAREQGRNHAVSVAQLRFNLESVGYDFSQYKNPNASLSGTLERLVESGELKKVRIKRSDDSRVTGYEADTGLKYAGQSETVQKAVKKALPGKDKK